MKSGNIKKTIVFIAFFAILLWGTHLQKRIDPLVPQIKFRESALYIRTDDGNQKNIEVEIAETHEQMAQGLMYRTSLPEGRGMLFLFPEERIGEMWMKNTYIPLDMLFIDKRRRIACLVENTTPQSTDIIRCDKPIVAVLEVPGGYAAKHQVKLGQTVMYYVPPIDKE